MSSASEALAALNWKPLSHRRYAHRCILIFKCINNLINYDFNLTFNSNIHVFRYKKLEGKAPFTLVP